MDKKRQPFNVGINEFKRLLDNSPMITKAQRNQAVKAYKKRINERLKEILALKEKAIDNDGKM